VLRMVRSSAFAKVVLAGLAAAMIPAAASAGRTVTSGQLILCSVSGVRQATGSFTFTFVTVASAGGTTTLTVPVGSCTGRLFYPVGVDVTVSETVPPGYAVTSIALGPTPGGVGTTSVLTSSTPATGSAVVRIGTGQATITFTTNGPSGAASLCKVPSVFGFSFTAAKAAIRRAHCAVGAVRKVHSRIYYPGIVYSQSPAPGAVLGPRSPVSLTVSLGRP